MQENIFFFLDYITFFIGLTGIFVITLGTIKGLYSFITRKTFWEIRIILVKHIMLGLDFLISRDIIETVILKSDTALWADLASLILIIVIRIVFSFFAEKELNELMDDKKELTKK